MPARVSFIRSERRVKMSDESERVKMVIEAAMEVKGVKKLSCGEAFRLAGELEIHVSEIGRICNKQKIKICNCQLGCFK